MKRGSFLGAILMVATAAVAGVFVATLAPPASTSAAPTTSSLKLAPAPTAPPISAPSFADLADKAIPSVVAVTSQKMVEVSDPHEMFFDNPFFRRFFREPFDDQERENNQPRKRPRTSSGSGFFITADGYILTNKHVVADAETLFVRTSEMGARDEALPAQLVGTDPFLDLALLKVEGDHFPPLPLGDSDKARVGEWVVAIGNPLYFRNSVTAGVLSGKGRRLEGANQDPSSLEDYLQTDAPINFGNSGGPLLNARGEVIGINSAIVRDNPNEAFARGYIEGLGFALPISPVKRVLGQLAATGTVKRGRLGISVQQVDAEKAEYLGLPGPKGAYVFSVEEGTPADKIGIKRDDVILSVDGKPVANQEELVNEISSRRPGEKVTLTVWRDRKEIKLEVGLIERTNEETAVAEKAPDKSDDAEGVTALGFTVGSIPPAQRERLAELDPPVKGVMVTDVDPTSSAATKGLSEGMVLMDLNGQATPTVDAYRRASGAVKPGEVVRLRLFDPRFGDEVTLFFRAPGRK